MKNSGNIRLIDNYPLPVLERRKHLLTPTISPDSSHYAGWLDEDRNSLGCFSLKFCVLSVLRTADCKTEIHNIFISAYCPDSSVLRRCWHGRGWRGGNQHTVWDESVQSSSEAADGDHQFLRIVTVSPPLCEGDVVRVFPPSPPPCQMVRWSATVQWEILWFPDQK